MRLTILAAVAAAALVVLAAAGWLLLSPGWAVAQAQQQVEQALGRKLQVRGGASLSLSPLAIRLEQLSVSSPRAEDESFLTARAAVIPVSLSDLLTRSWDGAGLVLEGAEFALLIDERGDISWDFGEGVPSLFGLTLRDSGVRYFDARHGQSLTVAGINGRLTGDGAGGLAFEGTADIGGRLAQLDAVLKSLPRVHDGGSPFDLALQSQSGDATFSGLLSTAKVLNLSGPVSLVSRDAMETLRWAGIAIDTGAALPLNIDGALDSVGRAFAIRDAAITFGTFRAAGRVVFDLRGATPKLQADLKAPSLDIGPLVPASGGGADWGTRTIGFGLLKTFDGEIAMRMDSVSYNGLVTGAAQTLVTLVAGKLEGSLAARAADGGVISVRSVVEAGQIPPQVSLDFKAENTDAGPVLSALTGQSWLSGKGTLAASLKASGATQQDMAGTLAGTASLGLADGTIAGIDIATQLPAVTQRILDGWVAAEQRTGFTSLSASATIADGIATLASLALEAPGVKLSATGEADVLRRAVDLRATPQIVAPESGTVTGLPVGVIVKGPWDKPRIYPDIEGILLNPEAGFARLRDMGLSTGN